MGIFSKSPPAFPLLRCFLQGMYIPEIVTVIRFILKNDFTNNIIFFYHNRVVNLSVLKSKFWKDLFLFVVSPTPSWGERIWIVAEIPAAPALSLRWGSARGWALRDRPRQLWEGKAALSWDTLLCLRAPWTTLRR